MTANMRLRMEHGVTGLLSTGGPRLMTRPAGKIAEMATYSASTPWKVRRASFSHHPALPTVSLAKFSGRSGLRSVAVAAEIDWAEWYPDRASPSSSSGEGGGSDPSTSRPSFPLRNVGGGRIPVPQSGERQGVRAPNSYHKDAPVKLYKRTFQDARSCRNYFNQLRENTEPFKDFPEFEHNMVFALLREGHPLAEKKVGCGIVAFQVRPLLVKGSLSNSFFFVRSDGTFDDFSARKCINRLFPNSGQQKPGQKTPMNGGIKRS